ncbi:ATP-binding protein [Aurantivibrio plasticivorans]
MRIFTEQSYFSHKRHLDVAYFGIFGLYFAFAVFFIVVYAQQRDILYLIFSIQTIARALFDFAYSGELRLTISGYDDFISISYPYFGAFSAATALWFHAEFLQLRIFSRKMFWLTIGYALLFVAGAQIGLVVDSAVFFLLAPLQILLPVFIFFSTIPALMRRQQAARLYMIGIFIPLVLAVLNNLWLMNIIPMVYNFTLWSAIGYSFSFIILAFAMSARIEALADAKNDAEMEAFSAKARDNAKSEFLAHMSHEIRTPLNGVLAMIQMIRDSRLNKEQKQWVEIIQSSGQNLLNIVNDILDFSKIEAGKLSIEQLPTNVSDLIEEVVALYSQGGRDSDVDYTYTVDPSLPQWVRSDPIRIRQLLMNFLGNAKKFTKHGSIGVDVKTTENPQVFRISVTDTGIGIAKPQQKKLFNAFEQAESSTFRHFGGTGLGLTICQRLAHLMGGKVGFESEPNKGSCFWVELPFIECDAPRHVDKIEEVNSSEHQPLHILVAEDNAVNQTIITTILKKLGHTSLIASDGVEVVDLYCKNPSQFDVILMDCDMPKQDGYQATRVIREFEQEKQLNPAPIVALTAHAVKEFQAKSIACGMNEHLTKPIVISALSSMLANYQHENSQTIVDDVRQYV